MARLIEEVTKSYLTAISMFGKTKKEIEKDCVNDAYKNISFFNNGKVDKEDIYCFPLKSKSVSLNVNLKHLTVNCFFDKDLICQMINILVEDHKVYKVLQNKFKEHYETTPLGMPENYDGYVCISEGLILSSGYCKMIDAYMIFCHKVDIDMLYKFYSPKPSLIHAKA